MKQFKNVLFKVQGVTRAKNDTDRIGKLAFGTPLKSVVQYLSVNIVGVIYKSAEINYVQTKLLRMYSVAGYM